MFSHNNGKRWLIYNTRGKKKCAHKGEEDTLFSLIVIGNQGTTFFKITDHIQGKKVFRKKSIRKAPRLLETIIPFGLGISAQLWLLIQHS